MTPSVYTDGIFVRREVRTLRVKVVKRFVDRITKEMRYVGKEYEYSDERAKELADGGYVEPAASPALSKPKPKAGE